jgi:hypothetical protein
VTADTGPRWPSNYLIILPRANRAVASKDDALSTVITLLLASYTALDLEGPAIEFDWKMNFSSWCVQSGGGSHDHADAEWIVIRTQLRGHKDTPFGQPAPGRPSGRLGSGCPTGVFYMF